MKGFALAYLVLTCMYFLPLACSVTGVPLTYEDDPPDTAYALQERLWRALDSLQCVRVWDGADSAWDCPEPAPPKAISP